MKTTKLTMAAKNKRVFMKEVERAAQEAIWGALQKAEAEVSGYLQFSLRGYGKAELCLTDGATCEDWRVVPLHKLVTEYIEWQWLSEEPPDMATGEWLEGTASDFENQARRIRKAATKMKEMARNPSPEGME